MNATQPIREPHDGDDPLTDARPYNPDGRPFFSGFDPASVSSPAYVVDRAAVEHNLRILRDVGERSGARILLALKAFALPAVFALVAEHLDGACASGIYEATLAHNEIAPLRRRGDAPFTVHTFAPAYTDSDLRQLCAISDHITFNSLAQYDRLRPPAGTEFGIRINPECPLGEHEIYDPCAPYSRLGTTRKELDHDLAVRGGSIEGISGIHFHTLCENNSAALETTLSTVYERFGDILSRPEIRWFNMGGGHHITKPDYDRDHLVRLITDARKRFGVEVILEPGEAAAIHTGVLVSTVVDVTRNGLEIAILDTSATAHMPDILEMPYRPEIWGAQRPGESRPGEALPDQAPSLYRLGGQTCLAGDVIGDYAFSRPLEIGDRLVFDDMSHYTMVKTTTFNGIPLPTIAVWDSTRREIVHLRQPEYGDFRKRLGGTEGAL